MFLMFVYIHIHACNYSLAYHLEPGIKEQMIKTDQATQKYKFDSDLVPRNH